MIPRRISPSALRLFASLVLFGLPLGSQGVSRLVYPQALVGPFGEQTYEIELRLANRNAFAAWNGTLRLLRSLDMQGMAGVRFIDASGATINSPDGRQTLLIPPAGALYLRMVSDTFQSGVMSIEPAQSDVADLVSSFYYRLRDTRSGRIVDLVAIQPATSAATCFSTLLTQSDTFNVGLALVPEAAVASGQPSGSPAAISLGAAAGNDRQAAGMAWLGGSAPWHRAFFPYQAMTGIDAPIAASRLSIVASEPVYCAVLGVGSPPEFGNVQISAAPAAIEDPRKVPLRTLAAARGLIAGAAASPDYFSELLYAPTLTREFSLQTPENQLKFGPVHPERDRYDFRGADLILDSAERNAMQVRGHVLVWHQQNPSWLTGGTWTRDSLMEVLRQHISTVVGRYRGRIASWDVINEAVDDAGQLRNTIWRQTIGDDYLEMAFRWAQEADPGAQLFYNDYSAEGLGSKSDGVYNLVRNLLQRGVPIHGVGFQCHFSLAYAPRKEDMIANMKRLGDLGLTVHITELDVRIPTPVTDEKLSQQATIYANVCEACLVSPNCKALILWGVTDKHSWIPSTFPGYDAGLIFDTSYRPKPAYYALSDLLSSR